MLEAVGGSPEIVERCSREGSRARGGRRAPARAPRARARAARPRPPRRSRPITEARCSSRFSFVGSRSMRAAIIACSVSGIRSSRTRRPRAASAIVSSTKSGLPSVFSSSALRTDADSSPSSSSASRSSSLSARRERLERDRGGAQAAAAPAGPHVEQLGPGEADDQERRVADALGEVLDQLEQRLLGPVDVLEDEDERLRVGELGGPLAGRPGDLLRAPLGLDRLEHADRERRAGRRPRRRRSRRGASRPPPAPDRRP